MTVRRKAAAWVWAACAILAGGSPSAPVLAADAPADPPARIEARSASYLIVGVVHGGSMTIHLSRLLDNAPVHDAALEVALRGAAHAAVAQVDGSYLLEAKELALPGPVAVEFRVGAGAGVERLGGTLEAAGAAAGADDKGTWRNLAWWVLNFTVCIGFLLLWSARRKRAAAAEAAAAHDDQ